MLPDFGMSDEFDEMAWMSITTSQNGLLCLGKLQRASKQTLRIDRARPTENQLLRRKNASRPSRPGRLLLQRHRALQSKRLATPSVCLTTSLVPSRAVTLQSSALMARKYLNLQLLSAYSAPSRGQASTLISTPAQPAQRRSAGSLRCRHRVATLVVPAGAGQRQHLTAPLPQCHSCC